MEKPFGIGVSPQTLGLWREVEKYFGHPIREGTLDFSKSGYGLSGVDEDGRPWINLSPPGRTEENLIHELMHLKLKSQGYPGLNIEFPEGRATPANKEFMQWISLTVRDPIEHWIFYPEIRKMGFEPDPEMAVDFKKAIKRDSYQGLQPGTIHEALTIYYFEAMTLLDDEQLRDDVTAWYQRKGWISEIDVGRTMSNIVLRQRPHTPEEEISAFIECLNLLLKGTARFEKGEWRSQKQGNFTKRLVTIRVLPP